MLATRTPFRLSLGGGSTDLPTYYSRYGGFIFGVAIDLYFDVFLRKPRTDDDIHFQYSEYEVVDLPSKLCHNIGREALKIAGVDRAVSVAFKADTPAGTGLGSSGSCAVGLLNALFRSRGIVKTQRELAEHAFEITQNLGWPDGKQDPYIAAIGGFVVMDIGKNGIVSLRDPEISEKTKATFLKRTLLFYTGVRRDAKEILAAQDNQKVLELKHRTRELGNAILAAFQEERLDDFGGLMDAHWRIKRAMSPHMSNDSFDDIYAAARSAGAIGGKIPGAGGGGYFMFYVDEGAEASVTKALTERGLRKIDFGIDDMGTRALFEE